MTVVRMNSTGLLLAPYREFQIPAAIFVPTNTDGATPEVVTWLGTGSGIETTFDVQRFEGGLVAQAIQFPWTPPDAWNRGELSFKIHWARAGYTVPSGGAEPTPEEDVVWRITLYALGDHERIGAIATALVRSGDTWYADGFKHIAQLAALTPSGTPALGKEVVIEIRRDVTEENATLLNADVDFIDLQVQYKEGSSRVKKWS